MRRFELPVLPLILGPTPIADCRSPIAERQGRRALQLSGGDLSGLLGGPVSYGIYALICIILVAPLVRRHLLRPGPFSRVR